MHILLLKDYDYNRKDSNEWFRGDTHEDSLPQERERQDELMRFFAERIDRLSCQIEDARERLRQKQEQGAAAGGGAGRLIDASVLGILHRFLKVLRVSVSDHSSEA